MVMQHCGRWWFLSYVAIWLGISSSIVHAKYPNTPPRMDMCMGTKKALCHYKKACVWSESGAPDCYEKAYFFLKNPPPTDPLDTVVRFFEFSYGVHLSEGTNQQTHLVTEVGECAQLCLASTGTSGIRCLSFDYYPHEYPIFTPPFNETYRSGVCILNSENQDTARLRNSDMGVTDAELFYKSNPTYRPFSGEEGFYQLRDVRGGQIAIMLQYTPKGVQFTANNIWPRSRWGLVYLSVPIEIAVGYICNEPDDEPYNSSLIIDPAVGSSVQFSQDASGRFTGAFTPVDWDQHCVGKLNKPAAAQLCQQSGGYLCSPQEIALSKSVKLGCGLDTYPMWAASDLTPKGNATQKFVRCCSRFSVLNICPFFTRTQMDFCASLPDENACISHGSGTARQATMGFGRMRDFYVRSCRDGTLPCKGMVKDWSTRDSCIWCPKTGDIEGGTGECRAGNDIGVCRNAPIDMQNLFVLKVKAQCTSKTVCRVATRYEEKAVLFDAYTPRPTSASPSVPTDSPTSFSPTRRPTTLSPTKKTSSPTSKSPSRSPSAAPTTSKPSHQPSKAPTSSKPTGSPSTAPSISKPTTSPTSSLPTISPTSSSPTHSPSKIPTSSHPSQTPSAVPTTSHPSTVPSKGPTTSTPSHTPSKGPTSSNPTEAPSAHPTTSIPSPAPSDAPTDSPTSTPSSSPSDAPSPIG